MAYSNVPGMNPSTIDFRLATVTVARGSTSEHQELITLADPTSSLGVARVLGAPMASTEFGLGVRIISGASSAADNQVQISGNSTVIQGTNPWVIGGASSVRANLSSTAADNPVQVSGNSTVFQGGSPWSVQPSSTGWASSAGFHFNSSGELITVASFTGSTTVQVSSVGGKVLVAPNSTSPEPAFSVRISDGSTWVVDYAQGSTFVSTLVAGGVNFLRASASPSAASTDTFVMPWGSTAGAQVVVNADSSGGLVFVGDGANNALRVNVVAGAAGGSTIITIAAVAAGAGRLNIGSTAADNVVSIGGATVRMNIGSTAADNAVLVSGNSTVFQGGSPWTVNIGTAIQSTVAPSSGSSGIVVRQVIDGITTFASTSALASTVLSCASSVANIRAYVTAYTVTSTNQTPAQWGFFSSNGTLLWPMTLAALSSGVTGVNLAVSPPGYLFRTAVGEALNFKTNGSTLISVQLGVSYYQAP